MSVYFQNFPTIQYDMYDDAHTMEMVDIFRTVRPKASIKEDLLLYNKYTIQDGERPDHLSQKLYGSPDYYWTFFMVNENLVNLHTDWPLSRKEFDTMVKSKYDGYVLTTDEDISVSFIKGETVQGLISGATGTLVYKDCNTNTLRITNISGEFRADELVRGLTSLDTITITGQTEFYNATRHYIDSDGNVGIGATPSIWNSTTKSWELDIVQAEITARNQRNQLLSMVDRVNPVWYDSLSAEQRQALQTYRQQLLDVPQQEGFPTTVVWPTQPSWL